MEPPVRVGQVVAGKYEIERFLAHGGGGIVVKAKHRQLLEPCAIKLMLPGAVDQPQARERFLREARACARLKGDHVVKVFDVGELGDGTLYIVLEYLEGVDLDDHMSGLPLPVAEAASYVLPVCAALAEAHALGIVHRDVKPANVFLARLPDGTTRVKLLDFGVSKLLCAPEGSDQVETLVGTIVGTPFFMAPEQVRGAQVDARTDVWALGVLLYYLVTARLPFPGRLPTATFQGILDKDPPPPSAHLPSIPPELEITILRCLQKDPANRPASVLEVAEAIAPFAAGDGAAASSRRGLALGPEAPPTAPAGIAPAGELASSAAPLASAPTVSLAPAPQASTVPDPWRSRWVQPAAIAGCLASAAIAAALAPRSSEARTTPRGAATRPTAIAVPSARSADEEAPTTPPPRTAPAASSQRASPPPPAAPSPRPPSSLNAPGFELGSRR